MKKVIFALLLINVISSDLSAQNDADRAFILKETNVEKLKELSTNSETAFSNMLRDSSVTEEIIYKNGQIARLTGVDKAGKPVYSADDNESASISSKINLIQIGGASGFDLDGTGVEIGVWESTLPRLSHQELLGKITHVEDEEEGGHATHTAATILGEGINSLAKGMAPGATILSSDSYGDEPEIIDFALAGGILSNHSYSSNNPDGGTSGYGVYTLYAAEWDEILFNAPYLTIVKSASNSRNDGVNVGDGGYDIIFGSGGSKNTLTIGAVDDVLEYTGPNSVVQSEFSNWGPTDDWRIKPDITANGVSVLSADVDFDTDYRERSGTSMSTAVVSGAIALLQQFYHDRTGAYMKAATVKSLLTCTTDELGTHDGPDFQSGWGLLNAERAAEVISNDGTISKILELSIAESEVVEFEIEVDGNSSLELTMAWTDPAGTPLGGLDNTTSMLVQDLDVKIFDSNNVYLPWTLIPDASFTNFTVGASKGDNFRDNIERIDVSNIAEGTYTVSVSHKNSLVNGIQDFSMVINGILEDPLALTNENEYDFLVYPVPSQDGKLNVRIPENIYTGEYTLQLSDINGRLLSSKIYSEKEISLDVSYLSAGMYFINIQTNQQLYTEKMLIER